MTLEVFLMLLMAVSIMTGLFTEAIKRWMDEQGMTYHSNALAGYVAIALSALIWAAYIVLVQTAINAQMIVILIALVLLSWLSAMVGYDKVIQAIGQIRGGNV